MHLLPWHNKSRHFRAMGCGQKVFQLVCRCYQFLSGFLPKGHFPWGSRQSCLSGKDKGHNEMIPGDVHSNPGIYLITEENTRKSQLRDRRQRLCDQSRPQMGSLASKWDRQDRTACQERRRKEKGKKGDGNMTDRNFMTHCKIGCNVIWHNKTTKVKCTIRNGYNLSMYNRTSQLHSRIQSGFNIPRHNKTRQFHDTIQNMQF